MDTARRSERNYGVDGLVTELTARRLQLSFNSSDSFRTKDTSKGRWLEFRRYSRIVFFERRDGIAFARTPSTNVSRRTVHFWRVDEPRSIFSILDVDARDRQLGKPPRRVPANVKISVAVFTTGHEDTGLIIFPRM